MVILTKLDKEDFKKILEKYNIGKLKSYKHVTWALENTVYFVNTTKGKYVLKIFETRDPRYVHFQVKIVDFVQKKNLPVPKIIKTKAGKNLGIYNNKNIIIHKFVDGKPVKKLTEKLVKEIAKKQGSMNKKLLRLNLKAPYTWGKNRQFKPISFVKPKFGDFDLQKNADKLLKDIQKIKRTKLRRSIIHGDFHTINLLVKNHKLVAILDWDDAHEDFLVTEIAVFIAHSILSSGGLNRKYLKLYLKGYQKELKLHKEEQKAIYYFIKSRYLGAIGWSLKQWKKHPDQRKHIENWISNAIGSYKILDSISLEEFLSFF
ncbi:MAG: homoserine kinase [Nanoarchaeota archaeon]|nr:homoserine kinase [Nanoarchaeota archaeon]